MATPEPFKARSKTKDNILRTALALFNNEGEANVSSVDIAAVMEISPGNLYYHYKGKDAIITELYSDFETEMMQVLSAPINKPLKLEDNWVYLYIIFEEIYDFRFFYLNLTSLLERIPALAPRFRRLLTVMNRTFGQLLKNLEEKGHINFVLDERSLLAERLCAHFTYWFAYAGLRGFTGNAKALIDEGVYSALSQIAPYWTAGREPYADLLREFLDAQTSRT